MNLKYNDVIRNAKRKKNRHWKTLAQFTKPLIIISELNWNYSRATTVRLKSDRDAFDHWGRWDGRGVREDES